MTTLYVNLIEILERFPFHPSSKPGLPFVGMWHIGQQVISYFVLKDKVSSWMPLTLVMKLFNRT